MDNSRFLSSASPKESNSSIWNETKFIVVSGGPIPFNMAYGAPNPATFPFLKAEVTLKGDRKKIDLDHEQMVKAMQYGRPVGHLPLIEHIKALVHQVYDPPLWSDRDVVVTFGSLDGLSKICKLFLNEGDCFFIPKPCYHGVFVASKHLQPTYVSVETDDDGLLPGSLKEALIRCQNSRGIPKLLYVNPGGGNPTGSVLSEARRHAIYDLACKYDFIILEDDPYYFLQFSDEPPPTFLHLDTEGRVIRMESFSKTLSAGMRLGYIIASKAIIKLLSLMVYGSHMHTSMLPQVMVSRLFDTWGLENYLLNIKRTRDFYKSQRDITLRAADKYLQGLCEWRVPSGGFYLWMKVPKLQDTKKLLLNCGRKKEVLFVPGCAFYVDTSDPSQYIRASYATTTEEEVDKAFSLLAEALREEIQREESLNH